MFHIKNYCFQDLHLAQELYTNRMEQGKCLLIPQKKNCKNIKRFIVLINYTNPMKHSHVSTAVCFKVQ